MSNKTFRVFVDKMGGTAATTYIANDGELFYDPTTTTLRIGDVFNGQMILGKIRKNKWKN